MPVRLDTGILLRITNRDDPLHFVFLDAARKIKNRADPTVTTLQNISEFWNVSTRPASAKGGLGLSLEQAEKRLRLLERLFTILTEPPTLYAKWRELVIAHRVLGVQVHDAKLVAAMSLHGITQILTLNSSYFARYPGITVLTP